MRKVPEPLDPYKRLMKLAEWFARVHDSGSKKAGRPKLRSKQDEHSETEFSKLRRRFDELSKATGADLVGEATRVAELHEQRITEIRAQLNALKEQHTDIEKRRRDFAEAAAGYQWEMTHKDKVDCIGPLKIEHSNEVSRIYLGPYKLAVADFPSGIELFKLIKQQHLRLDEDARKNWLDLRSQLLSLQESNSQVTWLQLKGVQKLRGSKLKKKEPILIYSLVMLREGRLEPGWSLSSRPPSLAQQAESINIPRSDHPGAADRIHSFRIDRIEASN